MALLGWAALVWTGDPVSSVRPVLLAAAMVTTWAVAMACMAYGIGVLKLPVSIIAPLTNSTALVAVAVGALAFSERRDLNLSAAIAWACKDQHLRGNDAPMGPGLDAADRATRCSGAKSWSGVMEIWRALSVSNQPFAVNRHNQETPGISSISAAHSVRTGPPWTG